jgi:hypothetical protein
MTPRSASPPSPGFDAREINRKAVKVWPTLRNLIVGMNGRPNGDIWRLNPANPPLEPGRPRLMACRQRA